MKSPQIFFTGLPVNTNENVYANAIRKVTKSLVNCNGIITLYSFGNITDPGISDIDIIAVFEDNARCDIDPLADLNYEERYLFSHSVFSITSSSFNELLKFCPPIKFDLIYGESIDNQYNVVCKEEIKSQTALEYLFINYIARNIENKYQYVKVRNFLLSAKAIKYDLELLNIKNELINEVIEEIIGLRKRWFYLDNPLKTFLDVYSSFFKEYNAFFPKLLRNKSIYFPQIKDYNFARNIIVSQGKAISYNFKNLFPFLKLFRNYSYYKSILSRTTEFNFNVPMMSSSHNSLQMDRFGFYDSLITNCNKRFPNFTPFANQFLIKTTHLK
ncbi:MAG: hypothetical protein H6609_19025 [Ignavibacteriales bacterium]|nr:hypothetical protein [Ignavibacteriales bacterium]